ncbi:MAG: glycosyltransferase family 4 protein [Planctomycetes bacterium]|nr:glycosyltransferase family 4 protein [Planctomycetota bacterium]
MRIAQLTPGTGSFFCGSCLRDNALVVALRALGHEAVSVPLYLPHLTDEEDASRGAPVFLGGINVYLQERSALFRRAPRWLDRLLDAPRLLRWASRRAGMTSPADLGTLTVSTLLGEEGRQAKELDRLAVWLASAEGPRPAVICLSNALLVGLARRLRAATGAPIVCTLQGEDAFLDGLPSPHRDDAWRTLAARAAEIDAFVAVSRYYGDTMTRRLGLRTERVHVVPNGIALGGFDVAAAAPDPPAVGYLARMCPAKGLDVLAEAFVKLKGGGRVPGLRLRVAGACTPEDEPFVASVRRRLAGAGCLADAEFRPNLDRVEKQAFLRGVTVFSVPATYGESFGLYVLEALASGVPVVAPRHAAFPEVLEATGGGLLCEPGDATALAAALESLLLDPARARALGLRGREAVLRDFGVARMARGVAGVLASVAAGR